jgi:hypothetical protein
MHSAGVNSVHRNPIRDEIFPRIPVALRWVADHALGGIGASLDGHHALRRLVCSQRYKNDAITRSAFPGASQSDALARFIAGADFTDGNDDLVSGS